MECKDSNNLSSTAIKFIKDSLKHPLIYDIAKDVSLTDDDISPIVTEKIFLSVLFKLLLGDIGLDIYRGYKIKSSNHEIVIMKNDFLIASFDYVHYLDTLVEKKDKLESNDFFDPPLNFIVDEEKVLYKFDYIEAEYKKTDFNTMFKDLYDSLLDIEKKLIDHEIKNQMIKYVLDSVKSYSLGNTITNIVSSYLRFEEIELSSTLDFSFISNDEKGFETVLYNAILSEPEGTIGRYMSLDSFFKTISEKKMYFGSIIGMNDKNEVDYYEKLVHQKTHYFESCSKIDIKNINTKFITSYVTDNKIDNLTLWRLYGDDAKGICLVFRIKDSYSKNFYLKKIDYADSNGNHDKIEFLSSFTRYFEQSEYSDIRKIGSFKFDRSFIWRYFFKSKEYREEEEVRLLYCNENNKTEPKWRLVNNIVIPSVNLDLKDKEFPLELKEVIIGPKAYERNINLRQIELFLESNNFYKVHVRPSTINNYR